MATPMTTPARVEPYRFIGVAVFDVEFGEVGSLIGSVGDGRYRFEFSEGRTLELWPSEVQKVEDDELVIATVEWETDLGGEVAGLLPDGGWFTAALLSDQMVKDMRAVKADVCAAAEVA